jgi:mannitol-1-phosphate 5-dehydrogenase
MEKLVQFGAGNIGRSFLGQLFARGGYEVVFIDIDVALVAALNSRRAYRVIIKQGDRPDETIWVRNVRAVNARDAEAVAVEVAEASILGTSVGSRALDGVLPLIAKGLALRRECYGDRPLDIIIAENLHSASEFFRDGLRESLPEGFALGGLVGLIETSIGKMVPIMREEDRRRDPLWVFAEPYNRLILDKRGFRNLIPAVEGLAPVENIKAYVDRKLFIHNLGHAAAAYFGFQSAPDRTYVWEVLEAPEVFERARRAMMESAKALCREYPETFSMSRLEGHVDDLLRRFRNRALGDTVFRVGRDLYRKLGKTDRLIGALLLGKKHDCETEEIARAVAAAARFRATDEKGEMFPDDTAFAEQEFPKGLERVLTHVCGLSRDDPLEARAMAEILRVGG